MLNHLLLAGGRIIGLIPFPRVLVVFEICMVVCFHVFLSITKLNTTEPKIKQIVTKKWQQLWMKIPTISSFKIQPILKKRKLDPNNTRREETTLTRLRIGHTQLTHSFILKEEPPLKCPCRNQYSIKHILIECTKLNHTRKKFYQANSMKELLKKIAHKNIINFLKTIDLLLKI